MNVTAMLFTRLKETRNSRKRTKRFVLKCENYRPSEGGRFSVSMNVGVCMSGKEAVSVDMTVCVSGLEKLAVSS